MYAETVYRSEKYGGQLHKECQPKYDAFYEAELAMTGKEVPNDPVHEMPDHQERDPAPHSSTEILRNQRPHLTLVPPVSRPDRKANPGNGDTDDPVLLGSVIPFPGKT